MLARTALVDRALPCPPWSSSDDIEVALRSLAASSKKTGLAACSGLLFAVGNHHARTYWPAVLAVIPRLAPILRDGTEIARARALSVLLDLALLSSPEPGFELVDTPAGRRDLAHLVLEEIARLALAIEDLASSEEVSSKVTRRARELLSCIAERPPRSLVPGG